MKGPHCGADGGRQDSCGEGRPKAHLEVVTTEEGRMWSGSLDFTHELGRGLQKMTAHEISFYGGQPLRQRLTSNGSGTRHAPGSTRKYSDRGTIHASCRCLTHVHDCTAVHDV